MAASLPMYPQAPGRGCAAFCPAGELCHRRLDMLTRSLLSAVFCLLLIALQPLPVEAESILPDGRTTTTMRPWLDKRARQWLDAREPLTVGVVSPTIRRCPSSTQAPTRASRPITWPWCSSGRCASGTFRRGRRQSTRCRKGRSTCLASVARSRPDNTACWHPLRIFPTGRYWCLPAVPRSIRRRSPGWPRSRAIFPPNVSRLPIRTAGSSGSTRRSLPWKR